MKRIAFLLQLLILTFVFTSCKDDEEPKLGELQIQISVNKYTYPLGFVTNIDKEATVKFYKGLNIHTSGYKYDHEKKAMVSGDKILTPDFEVQSDDLGYATIKAPYDLYAAVIITPKLPTKYLVMNVRIEKEYQVYKETIEQI